MRDLLDSLNPDDIVYARLSEAFGSAVNSITPTEQNPVTDSFERVLLEIECSLLAKLDPADMAPHRAALPVAAAAPRVSNATFDLVSPPSGHSTKTIYTPYYAAPGELVTITFPTAVSNINLDVRVSHLRSGNGGNNFPVMPNQMINFDVNSTTMQVANPHGGLIQIIVPGNVTWSGTQQITVSGAVEAPYFKLGDSTDAAWVAGIRDRGTPFGVLDSPEATLVLHADLWLRTLDDPEAVITEWDYFCGKVREFYFYDAGRQLPVHHDYYAAGGVSTYPQSYGRTSNLVDSLSLKASAYALTLHEYGHICDSGNFQFHEFGETSPNLGGKWLQATARKYAWKQELTVGRINNYFRLSTDDLWNHYNHYAVDVKGTPFDLLTVEFGTSLVKDIVASMSAMPSSNFPNSQAKIDEWIRQTSNRTGFNTSAFFAAWQLSGSTAVQAEVSGLTAWMPIERVEETLTITQDTAVKFVDPSINDFSYDGGLTLVSVGQPSNGTVTSNGDGTYTYTPTASFTGSDSFTYTVSNNTGNQFTSTIPVAVVAAASDPKLAAFDGYAEGGTWTTVNLEKSYTSMIVIAQPLVSGQAPPMATRIRNASGSSFEVKLDRLDGSASPVGFTGVRFLVVEEGVYNVATHGIKMEAVKYSSTTTDTGGNFVGTERPYAYTGYDHYFIPTVFGQVMSSNDTSWSAFWYKAGNNSIVLGKHVGEDPNTSRAAEDIGYLVIEAGSYQIGDYQLQIGNAGTDGYAGFGNLSESGSSNVFDRFPTIHSALTSSDLSVPWGGSNPGEDGFVSMQKTIGGNGISAYLTEDTLGDAETTTGSKSTSYLLAHYTGAGVLPSLDTATSLAGSQTLIDVLSNDANSSGVSITVSQPAHGQVVIHSDGNLIYTPDNGYTGSDSFTYTVDDGSSSVTAPVLVGVVAANPIQAGLVADRFNGVSGNSISNLTGSANYPDSPSSSSIWTSVDSGQNVGDSLGHRVYGVIVPPTTGDYTFWIASDDHSQLSISSDNDPSNLAVVANVSGWTGYQNWDQSGSQKSSVLQLEAGKAYAVEILHKEGGGGDHVAVAWEGPGFTRTLLTTPAIFTSGDNAPTLANAPSNVSMDEGAAPVVIDLSGVFADGDPGDSVSVGLHGNTNTNLIQAVMNGSDLTLTHLGNETGTVTITVRGTDRLNTLVTTSFDVTVNDTNPDSDSDGLTDSWEVTHFGSVSAQNGSGDPDNDGLSNAGELAAGTDPNNGDSDNDGFADALEVAQGSDPADGGDTPSAVYADLHSYWPMNETAGNIASDYSGNGYAGTVTGASFVAGRNQNALSLDGGTDQMNAGSQAALLGSGDFSISMWAKTAAGFNATGTLIQQREAGGSGYQGEYMLNVNGNGTVTFFIYNSGYQVNLTTTTTVNDGNWHHFAVRRTGANVDILIDGQVAASGSGTVKALLAREVSVGYDARDNGNYFNGDIDEVMVFSRSLSNADIDELGGAPSIAAATFAVNENSSVSTAVGNVVANDPDSDALSYAITSGNTGGAFSIDTNGQIEVAGAIDFETTPAYTLTVEVTDAIGFTNSAVITVNVNDVNEAPTASNTSGSIAENAASGGNVATVSASDADAGDTLGYAITAGNGSGLFAIDSSGNVTTTAGLDYESSAQHVLTVTVTDSGSLTDTATVTVNVTNVNESPVAQNTSGAIAEDSTTGSSVASVSASDPDAGDTLGYAITGGNTGGAFAIDSNGNITTATALDYETTSAYTLTVTVTDSGSLTDTATVNVTVTDVMEVTAPAVATGSASGMTQTAADVAFSVTDDGGEASTVTVYYGETNEGTNAGAWSNSIAQGNLTTGNYTSGLTGLTEGTTYYFTVRAVNSAGEAWGSVGSFATEADSSPKLVRTTVNGVSSGSWTSVDLGQSYNSAVIIATPIYPNSSVAPVVTRIRNVSGSGFEVKIDRADGQTGAVSCDVSIVAVEEGVYTVANDGVKMEAVKYTSTITGAKNAWTSESRSYQNAYTSPVVVGQVMSANDADWSTFWCHGSSRTSPPNAGNLNLGKMVAEDPDKTRANETVGYIVIESGNGSINGVNYTAGVGSDIVRGTGNTSSGYNYSLSGLTTASAAAVSLAGLDGGDGGWAVLYGANPITSTQLTIACDEDQLANSERKHTTEQVGYLVFE
ncbi:MAG: cadherin domain-containing protein [Akkermansiaceae bacterium]